MSGIFDKFINLIVTIAVFAFVIFVVIWVYNNSDQVGSILTGIGSAIANIAVGVINGVKVLFNTIVNAF